MPWTNTETRYGERSASITRLYIVLLLITLPLTALLLVIVSLLAPFSPHPDITGLTAVSVGITGCLFFFAFLYRCQVGVTLSFRRRRALLLQHFVTTIVFFALVAWLGFESPWRNVLLWGSYDLETCSRSWIISVLVVGSLTLLASVFDFIRLIDRIGKGDPGPTSGRE